MSAPPTLSAMPHKPHNATLRHSECDMTVCVVGPMVGRNPGCVTSQGEILSDALAADGWRVHAASAAPSRLRRLVEIALAVWRHRSDAPILVVETYGGRSFVVEDVATALGRRAGYRIVLHLHGGAMPAFMARFPRWSRRVLDRADAIVAPTPYLARAVAAAGYRATVIPNVVDIVTDVDDDALRARVRPRLLWMRSFHPLYNPMLAVRVLARLRARYPEASLAMAGYDAGMEADVRREVARRGLDDAVRFVGFLDDAGKRREGRAADVFISTNRVDNAPVAVVEAAAMGLPIVATDVGGLRDLLDAGTYGLLVPDDDDAAMAAAVIRLVEDAALAAALSTAGRRLAAGSSWQQVGPRWTSLFDALATGGCA